MLKFLRILGLLEGFSFLALMGVGLPLKYVAGEPGMVKLWGPIHGILFTAFVFCALGVGIDESWPRRRVLLAWLAALLPFGPFLFDRRLFAPPPSAGN